MNPTPPPRPVSLPPVDRIAIPIANYAYDPQALADEQHLRLLGIFHYIWAGLIAVFACIPLIHVAIGVALLSGSFGGTNAPPREVGYVFIGIGGLAILLGWTIAVLNFLSARGIGQRKWRMLSLVVAGMNCLSVPIGTAIGVFTFVVLLRQSVAALYGVAPPMLPYAPPGVQR